MIFGNLYERWSLLMLEIGNMNLFRGTKVEQELTLSGHILRKERGKLVWH